MVRRAWRTKEAIRASPSDGRNEDAGRRALAGLGQSVDDEPETGRQQAQPEDVELEQAVGPVVTREDAHGQAMATIPIGMFT